VIPEQQAEFTRAAQAFRSLREVLTRDRAEWAGRDPVAYLWLRRAERRGAVVPWNWP
jgi:hypothetical protein